jgi:site-specific DNA-adenine methylase
MFIPYLGEKSKFSNFIIPNIPSEISTYVEPFGGMFGIFFSMNLKLYPNTTFVYNDQNELNYNLFKCIKEKDTFINILNHTSATEEKYYNI